MALQGQLAAHSSACRRWGPRSCGLLASKAPVIRRPARMPCQPQAISIDRRHHMELAWQRQQQYDAQAPQDIELLSSGKVLELRDLSHLETLTSAFESTVIVICFYKRSCGTCKNMLLKYGQLAQDAKREWARAVFLKHDIINEFDDVSDVARLYKVKATPGFIFFDDGAVAKRLSLRDVREIAGDKVDLQQAMSDDVSKLHSTVRQVILKAAPGARP